MVCHFVRYRGSAADPSAFIAHYRDAYASILRGFPGIKSLVLHTPAKVHDPCPVRPGGTALLAQMIFDNEAALNAALKSDSRERARDDFARFGTLNGEVTHEALAGEVIV
jgi:uncharacterized protein (TIGR02118 family)